MSDDFTRELFEGYADEAQQRDFFAAIGEAISGWQFIEAALYLLFEAAVLPAIPGALSAAFHQIQTFRMKLQTTDMVIKYTLLERTKQGTLYDDGRMLGEWMELYKRLAEKNERRNELAHFNVRIVHGKKAKYERVRLRPLINDARYSEGLRRKPDYGVTEISNWPEIFFALGKDVMAFSLKMRSIAGAEPQASL